MPVASIPVGAAEILRIPGPPGGQPLGLRERRCRDTTNKPPIILIHGATLGAALFDLPCAGYSLMEALAADGRAVYALDIRGYGHSINGGPMDEPLEDNPPFARLSDATDDIHCAVEFVRKREQANEIDMIGFSWGTVTCGAYAGRYPRLVRRLALYAPLYAQVNEGWRNLIGDPADRTRISPQIGAYRFISERDLLERWDRDLGVPDPSRHREDVIVRAIFEAFAMIDPTSRTRSPPSFRSPTGALADLISVFNGRPLYDPGKLTMPVLLIRGSLDTTSTDNDTRTLLAAIPSSGKKYVQVPGGSHFVCVEKNRGYLYDELGDFFRSF
ncbi:MAG: alpha/beta hydrolase [Rhizobiaceae bacterium]